MGIRDLKFNIIEQVVANDNVSFLKKIEQLLLEFSEKSGTAISDKNNPQKEEEDFDANKLSFAEWNEQFTDEGDLDALLPEYGMTLRQFRMSIYESERAESMTLEELGKEIESWKNR